MNSERRRPTTPESLHKPARIISGGQTGADRAALDFAIENNIPHGGYCPRGRRTENGTVPARYNLTECNSYGYPERTERNIRESDATIIITGPIITPGSRYTQSMARKLGKPARLICATSPEQAARELAAFLHEHRPAVLNVAGSRESKAPGIGELTKAALEKAWALEQIPDTPGQTEILFGNPAPPPPAGLRIISDLLTTDLYKHPDYNKAKSHGDHAAALRLVKDLLTADHLAEIRRQSAGAHLVYPAKQGHSTNKIPAALAAWISNNTALLVHEGIAILPRDGYTHTGATAAQRFCAPPEYHGPVTAGQSYFLLDDVITQGGTLNHLRLHITQAGGRIAGGLTLAHTPPKSIRQGDARDLTLAPLTARRLDAKFGAANLDSIFTDLEIYDGNHKNITNSEGLWILLFGSADRLRACLSAAKSNEGPEHHAQPSRDQRQPESVTCSAL